MSEFSISSDEGVLSPREALEPRAAPLPQALPSSRREPPRERSQYTTSPRVRNADASPTDSAAREAAKVNKEILHQVNKLYLPPEAPSAIRPRSSGLFRRRTLDKSKEDWKLSGSLGLLALSKELDVPLGVSDRKAAVMIIGNISAGKSTFINWFAREPVQRTGMAVETSGLTIVSTGRCMSEMVGDAVIALRPWLEPIARKHRNLLDHLTLKTCPSTETRLQGLDLIDTPGLSDGDVQYPFDVDSVIIDMAPVVDLFLVFFDPMGQAMGKRLMSVVQRLSTLCPEKIRYCLTKIDGIRTEEERIKVVCQVAQSTGSRVSTKHGFDLVPMYVPGARDNAYLDPLGGGILNTASPYSETSGRAAYSMRRSGPVNRIGDIVSEISRITGFHVHNALIMAGRDIKALEVAAEQELQKCITAKAEVARRNAQKWRSLFLQLCLIAAAVLILIPLQLKFSSLYRYGNYLPSVERKLLRWLFTVSPGLPKEAQRLTRLAHKCKFKQAACTEKNVPSLFAADNDAYRILPALWCLWFLLFLFTTHWRAPPVQTSVGLPERVAQLEEARDYLQCARKRCVELQRRYLEHPTTEANDGEGSALLSTQEPHDEFPQVSKPSPATRSTQ